jgi:hypothetical protein
MHTSALALGISTVRGTEYPSAWRTLFLAREQKPGARSCACAHAEERSALQCRTDGSPRLSLAKGGFRRPRFTHALPYRRRLFLSELRIGIQLPHAFGAGRPELRIGLLSPHACSDSCLELRIGVPSAQALACPRSLLFLERRVGLLPTHAPGVSCLDLRIGVTPSHALGGCCLELRIGVASTHSFRGSCLEFGIGVPPAARFSIRGFGKRVRADRGREVEASARPI